MKKVIASIVATAIALSGCQQDKCAGADNPTECRAWANAGGDVDDYLVGGMVGYMLASSMQGGQRVYYIERDRRYSGPMRKLSRPLMGKEQQLKAENKRLQEKVARQNTELRQRQQNEIRAKQEAKAAKTGAQKSSFGSRRSFSSRPSFGGYRRR